MLEFLRRLLRKKTPEASSTNGRLQQAIAGQREVQASLEASEEHFYHLVVGVIDYAMFLLDPAGHVKTWNAGAERLKGWRAEEIIGQHFSRFYPIEAISSGWPTYELQQATQEGRFEDEGWRLRKDGSRFWANVVITALKDEAGHLRGFLKITRDLTERKHAEAKLRLSEERFRLLVEGAKDYAIFMLDPLGRIATWNAGAQRLKGWTAEEIIGQHFSRFYPSEAIERGWPDHELRMATQEGRFEDEGWRLRKDGSLFWANVVLTALRDEAGVLRGFSKLTRDLTQRKQAEEDARRLAVEQAARQAAEVSAEISRQSEERFRAIFEQAAVGMALVGLDGRWQRVNGRLCDIVGYGREELTELTFQAVTHPDDLEANLMNLRRVLAGEITTFSMEKRYVRKDQSLVWVNLTVTLVRTTQGQPSYFIAVVEDIAQRKRAEEALLEADRRKDEFLATLAHELRNPLAPIRNALQILRRTSDPEALEQARSTMQRQLEQMVRLVDDLLDVSRISTGKLQLRREAVSLRTVLSSAVETSRPLIDHMRHEFTVRVAEEPLTVDADPTRLAQVIANLLNNSAKYTERGGHIWLTGERQGSEVLVSVKDNGIGIAPEERPQLFAMFSQIEGSRARAQGGLGIGLTLVKRLVELHGGKVEVHSDGKGKGAEFIVRLPLVVEAPVPVVTDASDRPAPKSCQRILIVDDNRDSADTLAMLLRVMGHDIRTAYDGLEGVAAAEEFRPNVVLLDIGLPKLDGYQACRRIREQPWGRAMVLVAVTGWGQENDRRCSREAGFDHHMVKPVDPTDLEQLLNDVMAAT